MQTLDNSPEMQRFTAAVDCMPTGACPHYSAEECADAKARLEIPPVTLARLLSPEFRGYGDVFHFTGHNVYPDPCRKIVGPRGGVNFRIIRVRASGSLKTWKTRPGQFRLPIKYGMYESGEITHRNAGDFHFAADCPIKECRF